MKITDRFRSEHAVFLEQLHVLSGLLDAGEPTGAIVAAVRTLAAPLGRHARREEDALFPLLVPVTGEGGPIGALTEEHRFIERQIGVITGSSSRAELRFAFDAVAGTLRGHIAKEDDVLFPLAEGILGDERLAALDEPARVGAGG